MKYILLLTVFVGYIFHLNATKLNVEVTLHRQDIFPLFSESEIWGIQYNKTNDIVQLNVIIDESKSMEIQKFKQNIIMTFDIISSDVDEVIRRERSRINNTAKWTASSAPDLFFQEYRTWNEYVLFIDALLIRFPFITSRTVMGQTIEGRDIGVIRLSGPGGGPSEDRPALYIQAEVHAREWLANAATMYILNALCEGYGNDVEITDVLNTVNIFIVPTVNIDGYIYTWSGSNQRMWRKNRRNNGDGTYGVDLNRNWGPSDTWCTSGSSTNPSSDTYCGTSPFSEPEAEAAAQFIVNQSYHIGAAVDMHTSGPLILWPWQYTYDRLPPIDYEEFSDLGADLQSVIAAVHGVQYRSIQGSDLYPHSGGMIDYVWTESEIVGFTFEGRGPGFNPPADNIIPAGQEQLAAMIELAKTLYT